MTTETVRLDALVSLLLKRGCYPVAPECAGEDAQLINGQWHMPRWGGVVARHAGLPCAAEAVCLL